MTSEGLNATHRCDACLAQARMKFQHESIKGEHTGDLVDFLFCSHHSDKYGATLIASGYEVIADTREELTRKPVGAEVS